MRKYLCVDNKVSLKKVFWSKQEDQKLIAYINNNHGVSQAAGLLCGAKCCKLRWTNYLKADLKKGNFAEDEEDLIIKLHALLGNRWALIAGRLPGRTDNEVKNYWNSHLRKKLIKKGINPNNHRLTRNPPLITGNSASSSPLHNSSAKNDEDGPIKKPYGDQVLEEEQPFCILPGLNLDPKAIHDDDDGEDSATSSELRSSA